MKPISEMTLQVEHIIYGEGKDGLPLMFPVVSREAGEGIIPMLTGITNARVVSIEYIPSTPAPSNRRFHRENTQR